MGEVAVFGLLDVILLGGMAGLALYWFVLRKKKEETVTVKKLTVG